MMDCDARRRAMRSKNMKTVTIRLTMMTDNVKNFVSLVNRYPYDMDLRSGRYVVDAKSILGIFSIDLSRPITMSIYSDDCDDLLRDLDGYIVKDVPACAVVSHLNSNDKTCEGLEYPQMKALSVQFIPESEIGMKNFDGIYERFLSMIK